MWSENTDDRQQRVEMSSAEYHELKRHLAELRGYDLSPTTEGQDDLNVASEQPRPDDEVGPPKELVEEALDLTIQDARLDFANDLETAILVFRKYPDLVKRGKLPEEFRAAYVRAYNYEPLRASINDECMRSGFKRWAKKEAERVARVWMRDRLEHAASSNPTV